MNHSWDLSIGQRLAIGFGLILLVTVVKMVLTSRLDAASVAAQQEYSDSIMPSVHRAYSLESAVLQVGIRTRSVLLQPSPSRLADLRESTIDARSRLDALSAIQRSPDSEALYAPLARSVQLYLQTAEDHAERRSEGPVSHAHEVALGELRETLVAQLGQFLDLKSRKAESALARITETRSQTERGLRLAALVTLALLGTLGWLITSWVRSSAGSLLHASAALETGNWAPALELAPRTDEAHPRTAGAHPPSPRNEMSRIARALGSAATALRHREQRLIADGLIARVVGSNLDRGELADKVLKDIVRHLAVEIGVVYWVEGSRSLTPIASYALGDELPPVPIGEGLPGQAAKDRRLVYFGDMPADSGFEVRLGYDKAPARSVAALPLLFRDTLHGVLLVGSLHELSTDALAFLDASALQLSIGLQNVAAYEETQALLADLRDRNEEMQVQNEEIQAQSEEIQAQSEEIQAQSEQLQAQQEELQVQNEELLQHSAELRRQTALLTEADERKNQFLGVLAHELRNPMAPITNSIFILKRAEPGSDSAQRAQEIIERQATHLVRLIDDLLDVTRISEGKIHIQRERLDLVEVVRSCVEDLAAAIENAGLELELTLPDEPVVIEGDRTRLCQVLGNLLNNSIKFTDRGGHVEVSLQVDPARQSARLLVSDNGIGMEGDLLPKLFQPFSQGLSGLARTKGGLGLGLALVKALVALHDGHVEAHSRGSGRGAEFSVHLPLAAAHPELEVLPAATLDGSAQPARGNGVRRILVVEDNPDAAASLHEALGFDSHEVSVAHSGSEGVEKALQFMPDVVLCDVGLPGLDGYEVARELRARPETRSAILIAVTGYASDSDKRRAYAAGFDLHLVKPLQVDQLERILEDLSQSKA